MGGNKALLLRDVRLVSRCAGRGVASRRPVRHHQGGAPAQVEGVPAPALAVRPADGSGGAGGGPELHREAVPDAEAVEPAVLRLPGRRPLRPAPHGAVGLRSAAAGEPGGVALDTRSQSSSRAHGPSVRRCRKGCAGKECHMIIMPHETTSQSN